MDEYINATTLLKEIDYAFHTDTIGKKDVINLIVNLPVADITPVRHGRWEVGYFHDRVCSCCLHPDNDFDDYAHKFCPHCGAKMDGGLTDGC